MAALSAFVPLTDEQKLERDRIYWHKYSLIMFDVVYAVLRDVFREQWVRKFGFHWDDTTISRDGPNGPIYVSGDWLKFGFAAGPHVPRVLQQPIQRRTGNWSRGDNHMLEKLYTGDCSQWDDTALYAILTSTQYLLVPFDRHPASLSSHVKAMHDDRNKCIGHKATSAMEEAEFREARIRINAFVDCCETLGVLLPETCNDYRAEINAIAAKQFISDEEMNRLKAHHAREIEHEREARGAAEEAKGAAEEAKGAAEEARDAARRSRREAEMKRVVGERFYQKMAGYRKRRQAERLELGTVTEGTGEAWSSLKGSSQKRGFSKIKAEEDRWDQKYAKKHGSNGGNGGRGGIRGGGRGGSGGGDGGAKPIFSAAIRQSQIGNQGRHSTCSAWALAGAICDAARLSYGEELDLDQITTTLISTYRCWEGATLLDAVNGWNGFMEDTTHGPTYGGFTTEWRFRFKIRSKTFACFADTYADLRNVSSFRKHVGMVLIRQKDGTRMRHCVLLEAALDDGTITARNSYGPNKPTMVVTDDVDRQGDIEAQLNYSLSIELVDFEVWNDNSGKDDPVPPLPLDDMSKPDEDVQHGVGDEDKQVSLTGHIFPFVDFMGTYKLKKSFEMYMFETNTTRRLNLYAKKSARCYRMYLQDFDETSCTPELCKCQDFLYRGTDMSGRWMVTNARHVCVIRSSIPDEIAAEEGPSGGLDWQWYDGMKWHDDGALRCTPGDEGEEEVSSFFRELAELEDMAREASPKHIELAGGTVGDYMGLWERRKYWSMNDAPIYTMFNGPRGIVERGDLFYLYKKPDTSDKERIKEGFKDFEWMVTNSLWTVMNGEGDIRSSSDAEYPTSETNVDGDSDWWWDFLNAAPDDWQPDSSMKCTALEDESLSSYLSQALRDSCPSLVELETRIASRTPPDLLAEDCKLAVAATIELANGRSRLLPANVLGSSVACIVDVMYQLPLYKGKDLNIRAHLFEDASETVAHDHAARFISCCLQGGYEHQIHGVDKEHIEGAGAHIGVHRADGEGQQTEPETKDGKLVNVLCQPFEAGQAMFIHPLALHSVHVPGEGTEPLITIVFRSNTKVEKETSFLVSDHAELSDIRVKKATDIAPGVGAAKVQRVHEALLKFADIRSCGNVSVQPAASYLVAEYEAKLVDERAARRAAEERSSRLDAERKVAEDEAGQAKEVAREAEVARQLERKRRKDMVKVIGSGGAVSSTGQTWDTDQFPAEEQVVIRENRVAVANEVAKKEERIKKAAKREVLREMGMRIPTDLASESSSQGGGGG
eukprot:CAMPEP_0182534998 /NCGR_PEP_ID=MMETSP1323-20130603/16819_1 /TAXON_ID=236787 /ORGANISM="Florenciella parvula, Strain RCC1693" /LENGTH=1281 /DNA_ID=CAMNT_0024745077 /DNA_START=227 /DNA_END=4068 /DNA_ORIENTATION=-